MFSRPDRKNPLTHLRSRGLRGPRSATSKVATPLHGEIAPFRLISPRTEHPPQAAVRGSSPRQEDDPPGPLSCGNRGEEAKQAIVRSRLKETPSLMPLCFWPGRFQRPARMQSIRGKQGKSQGKVHFPLEIIPGFPGARSPLTFVNPSAAGGSCRFLPTALFRQVRVQGTQYPGGVWGETPAFPLQHIR